jgi:hypothetical protein
MLIVPFLMPNCLFCILNIAFHLVFLHFGKIIDEEYDTNVLATLIVISSKIILKV